MQLLDATLALALTLAALATIVSILVEAGLRTARMRKKNLVEVAKRLNKELDKGLLNVSPDERWKFITGMIENPALATTDLATELDKRSGSKDQGIASGPNPETTTTSSIDSRLARLGQDKADGKTKFRRFWILVSQLFGDRERASLYTNVSTEHVLRRLAETDEVQRLSREASELAKAELNRLALKYEEFGSAVSAGFKRHSQMWSIGVAVIFSLFTNIDGLRIFEAYRADADLARAVISHQEGLAANYDAAVVRQQNFQNAEAGVAEAKKALEAATDELSQLKADEADTTSQERFVSEKQEALNTANAVLQTQTSLAEIEETARVAQKEIADLVALGVPIGWRLYPNCPYGPTEADWDSAGPHCRDIALGDRTCSVKWTQSVANYLSGATEPKETALTGVVGTLVCDTRGFFRWLFAVVVTGLLIGLGAPFWFDVAKRLSMIRQVARHVASGETRHAGRDAEGSSEKRSEIVNDVVNDAAAMVRRRRRFMVED